eukprot:11060642-Alexandrium_andersonii.AAC.1
MCPTTALHQRVAQQLLHFREIPRGRRRRVLMEEARTARQVGPVELDRELHVDPRLLESVSHLILVHARVVDVLVEGTPIRTGWAHDKQKRASSSQQPNGEVTILQFAEVPRAP